MSEYEVGLKKQASGLLFILKNADMIRNHYNLLDSLYRTRQLSYLSFENLTKELMTLNEQGTEFDPEKSDFLNAHNLMIMKERKMLGCLKYLN